ncbi:hypothetical protein HD806DRAFT_181597 [Xylariaceae sp. AK1471]|nr:hypothetical protein HD806DRAFT_181597 [Xylariaceae sp. AK1471]
MQPKKSLVTTESNSVDNESTNTDPRPGRPSTTLPAGPSHLRRGSQSSLGSESRPRASISCVSRESMSADDCARQRFIVWAAVKRNRSVRMAASERLRCPLLRCGERFDGHEDMLRHLTQCQHLSAGEYVCYECMKVERFNDKKCRCCFRQPTKRRRIINMAKHFFSNIGSAKVRRENLSPSSHGDHLCLPPSYDSLVVDMHEQYDQTQMEGSASREEREWEDAQLRPEQTQLELNGIELLELDSTPLLPTAELDAVNYNSHPTDMPAPPDSCAATRETPSSPGPSVVPKPTESPSFQAMLHLDTGASGSGGRRPSLALNTQIDCYRTKPRTTYLSPSSSLRSSSYGISPITPWSASSKSSAIWSTASGRDTMLASPITPLSANAHPTALQEDRLFSTEKDKDILSCPEDPCQYTQGDMPELCGDNEPSFAIPRLLSDPFMSSYDSKDDFSWISSMNTEISFNTSVNMMFTDPNTKTAIPPDFLGPQISSSETKALVEQVWDALDAHFSNSASKLSRIQNNPLADNLRIQTPGAVASAGFTRLKRTLSRNYPTRPEPLEYLCFVHLMYSISLVIHEDSLITRSNKLYEQAMAYGELFDGAYRDNYYQVVTTIWQQNQPQGRLRESTNRLAEDKGKEPDYHTGSMVAMSPDSLEVTGQNFLDELENVMINSNTQQPMEVLSSGLWASHLPQNQPNLQGNAPLAIASGFLVQNLVRRYHDSENWSRKLKAIEQNARAGYYPTIRKLELELIQAGKVGRNLKFSLFHLTPSCDSSLDLSPIIFHVHLEVHPLIKWEAYFLIAFQSSVMSSLTLYLQNFFASDDFFDQYIPQVRGLCDEIYAQPGIQPRAEYHMLGISLVESLVRIIAREPQQPQEGNPEYPLNISNLPYPYEDEFLRDLNKTFGWNYLISPGTQQPVSNEGVPDFGPTLDPTSLHSTTSTGRLGSSTANHLPIRSDASETPSEPYTVSPAPLSDAPPELTASSSYRPTPPSQGQAEGSDTSGPSTLGSSGQKVEANERCEICGYRPKGDPQWFKGSMAKHKKMQHSTNPPIIFKCPFPGCNSEYKNRRDNLRQHQIEKNHFVGDEVTQRPPKRKRRDHT